MRIGVDRNGLPVRAAACTIGTAVGVEMWYAPLFEKNCMSNADAVAIVEPKTMT